MIINKETQKTLARLSISVPHSVILLGDSCSALIAGRELASSFLKLDDVSQLPYSNDFQEIDGAEIKNEGKAILEDAIVLAGMTAIGLSKRVFLVKNAEKLSVFAQNSLLKCLEEKEATSAFIFVASEPLLDTIASRCETVPFRAISKDTFGNDLDTIAYQASNGIIGMYQYVKDNEGLKQTLRDCVIALAGDKHELLDVLHASKEKDSESFFDNATKEDMTAFFQFMLNSVYSVITPYSCQEEYLAPLTKNMAQSDAITTCMALQKAFTSYQEGIYTKMDFFITLMKISERRYAA